MSSASSKPPSGKAKKKAPNHFKAGGAALIEGLIEGADAVAGRSFLGGGAAREAEDTPQPPSGGDPAVPPQAREAAPAGAMPPAPEAPVQTAPRTPARPELADSLPGGPGRHQPAAPGGLPAEKPAARRRARGVSDQPWAHAALHASFAEAKIHSEQWRSHGFRIEPEVLALLKERLKADRRTSSNAMLGQGHYLDAALRFVPHDVDEQIAMAQEFLDERMGFVEPGKQSTYRVGEQAFGLVSTLNQGLQEADYGRRGLYVVSAALERFLLAMDTEGALPRPVRRGRTGGSASG